MTDGLKRLGFTIIELLTVLAIIALLTGILVPSLNRVRRLAKETKQKAQLTAIDQAMLTFRNDYGDYPPSGQRDPVNNLYNGAMKLAEALVGWDLMGFHPESTFLALGDIADGGVYDPDESNDQGNLDARVGPYLEVSKANAFSLNQLGWGGGPFNDGNFVLCDSFGRINVTIGTTTYKAGLPVLYYRADRSQNTMSDLTSPPDNIYNCFDNIPLIALKDSLDNDNNSDPLRLGPADNALYDPAYKIIDQKVWQVQNVAWPYRPDSYILISAGVDGEYGTQDDITNCGN